MPQAAQAALYGAGVEDGEAATGADADAVAVDEGGRVVDGVGVGDEAVLGDELGVMGGAGANWIPRNMAFGFAAAM